MAELPNELHLPVLLNRAGNSDSYAHKMKREIVDHC